MIVVAARYKGKGPGRRLAFAQIYERHGPIWSDIKLSDRQQMIALIEAGKRVMSGRPLPLAHDFEVGARIGLQAVNGVQLILAEDFGGEGESSEGDDLGVPLL